MQISFKKLCDDDGMHRAREFSNYPKRPGPTNQSRISSFATTSRNARTRGRSDLPNLYLNNLNPNLSPGSNFPVPGGTSSKAKSAYFGNNNTAGKSCLKKKLDDKVTLDTNLSYCDANKADNYGKLSFYIGCFCSLISEFRYGSVR